MGKYHSKILMLFNLDFLSSIVLNFIKTDSRMTSAVLNIAEKCLTVTAVRPIRRFRDIRSSVMEVILVLTHSHWWDKANTPYMEYVV